MAERIPGLDGLQARVEAQVVPPPFAELRTRHRRRRRRRAVAGTLGLALVATTGAVAVLTREPAGPARLRLAADGLPVASFGFWATDVEFVSPTLGWLAGVSCAGSDCRIGVRRTADGGRSWGPESLVAAVPRSAFGQDPAGGAARSLRFADERTGWLFNPARYVTRDGGRTWLPDPAAGRTAGINARGSTPWFLVRPCVAGCPWQVAGAPSVPALRGSDAQLRRPGEGSAWLLEWGGGTSALWRTVDGGAAWTKAPSPPCGPSGYRLLSTVDDRIAWLACGTTTWRTADGGQSWHPAGSPATDGSLTDLVGLSDTTAWLATRQPARLLVTRDGGVTWSAAAGARSHHGFGNVLFVDPRHGWALGDRGDLWRTTDGERWHRLALPT